MLVSVIIPVYNGEKYIRKAIDSALNQTFKDYEIIVVNDGSTDHTDECLEYYEDDVRIINQDNMGTASALNHGIKLAKGEWIKWLSADDEMLPDCLETMVRNCTDHNTIYYTNYHIIDQHEKHVRDFVEPGRPKEDLWKLFFGNGSSSFIHKDVFERCGLFDESLRAGEDYEFWLRCTMLHNVNLTLIPEFTINYRQHPEQLTHKVDWKINNVIRERIQGQITAR